MVDKKEFGDNKNIFAGLLPITYHFDIHRIKIRVEHRYQSAKQRLHKEAEKAVFG